MLFKTAVIAVLAISSLATLRNSLFKPRPVIVLADGNFVIRGVRPGVWNFFQRWCLEKIDDERVISIKMGYLRGKRRFLFIRRPPGEPSRNAIYQWFLWIVYTENSQQKEIYYPHLKNIKGYRDLIQQLRMRFGSKCEEHWEFSL
jgi:hypothetical protein